MFLFPPNFPWFDPPPPFPTAAGAATVLQKSLEGDTPAGSRRLICLDISGGEGGSLQQENEEGKACHGPLMPSKDTCPSDKEWCKNILTNFLHYLRPRTIWYGRNMTLNVVLLSF